MNRFKKTETHDEMYEAMTAGKEMPGMLAFFRERLAAVRGAMQTISDGIFETGAGVNRRDLLQASPKLVMKYFRTSTLADIAKDLEDLVKDLESRPGARAAAQAPAPRSPQQVTVPVTLAQVRNQIRTERDPKKRADLARRARDLRES